MMGSTHIIVGMSSLWLLAVVPHALTPDTIGPLMACAAFGALLPDLDATSSTIRSLSVARIQPFVPLSVLLSRALGHRGATHSLLGLFVAAVLLLPVAFFWGWLFWLALLLGYGSHLAADACTKSGIPLMHPRRKRYHLLPLPYRLTTGSFAEETLTPLIALLVFILLLALLRQAQVAP